MEMDFSWIADKYINQFLPSYYFLSLHAFSCAYTVQKQSQVTDTRLKNIIGTIVLGCGGNIATSILIGDPILLFFNPKVIPVYSLASLLMNFDWIYMTFQRFLANQTLILNTISASSRAPALYHFIEKFRGMEVNKRLGRDAIASQIVLGTVSASGGGLLYQWFIKNQPFRIGGWYFNVIFVVTCLYIFFEELGKEYVSKTFGLSFSPTECKFLLILLVTSGFCLDSPVIKESLSSKTASPLTKDILSSKATVKGPFKSPKGQKAPDATTVAETKLKIPIVSIDLMKDLATPTRNAQNTTPLRRSTRKRS